MVKYCYLLPHKVPEVFEKVKSYLPDSLRTLEAFLYIYNLQNSAFFEVGDMEGAFWLSDMVPGDRANVHTVLWGENVKKQHARARQILKELFQLYSLRRLQAFIPTIFEAACSLADSLGFTLEGVLRRFDVYDGVRVDVAVYALLKEEL